MRVVFLLHGALDRRRRVDTYDQMENYGGVYFDLET